MSQALRQTKCSYLRLLYAKVRGCNTFVGALSKVDKTHADVIKQIEYRGAANGQSHTVVVVQHGNQVVSGNTKQGNHIKSLDTNLAPLSVTHFKEGKGLEAWKKTLVCGPNLHDATGNYVKACLEHEDDVLEENPHKIYDVKKETLKTLSVQELDRFFQIAVLTARKRSEMQAEIVKKASLESHGKGLVIYLAEVLGLQSKRVNAILKEIGYIFKTKTGTLPTDLISSSSLSQKLNNSHYQQKFAKPGNKIIRNSKRNSQKGIMYCADISESGPSGKDSSKGENRPSLEKITEVKDRCIEVLPNLIGKSHGLYYYRPDIVLENNYPDKPYVTVGLKEYVFQLGKLRWKVCMRYMQMGIHVMGVTTNEEEGSFCIHWRFNGILFRWFSLLTFWKWLPWNFSKTVEKEREVFEGLVTCYVDANAKIYKIRIDKVVVDPYGAEEKKPSLVEKLALGGNPV